MQIETVAKGKKDRLVPLTEKTREILRLYYIEYKPQVYLFNGQFGLQYSDNSCNAIVKKIHRQTIPHAHPPQCSNRIIRKGTDLKLIGDLLGHSSRKTTEIYTHTSSKSLKSYIRNLITVSRKTIIKNN
jgi:integrase/recombinase XerD